MSMDGPPVLGKRDDTERASLSLKFLDVDVPMLNARPTPGSV